MMSVFVTFDIVVLPSPIFPGVVFDDPDGQCRALVVGDDPGTHGLHFSHIHHGRNFPATTITMVSPGYWTSPSTWSGGAVPGPNDVVVIPAFRVSPSLSTRLTTPLFVTNRNGFTEIVVTDPEAGFEWVCPDAPVDLSLDPEQWGNVFGAVGGRLLVEGASKTPSVRIWGATAGETQLHMFSPVNGWRLGDKLVVQDVRQVQPSLLGPGLVNSQFELVEVTSVSADRLIVSLSSPLAFNHMEPRDGEGLIAFNPRVINLTRNVVLRSINPSLLNRRGHSVYHGRADVDLCHAEFRGLGRTTSAPLDNTTLDGSGNVTHVGTNQEARYSVHFHHHLGLQGGRPGGYQATIEGCSVWDPVVPNLDKWRIVLHNSHYIHVTNNVVYNCDREGVMLEDGSESYNLLEGNTVLRCSTGGSAAFWLGCPLSRADNNFVSGGYNGYAIQGTGANPGAVRSPLFPGADTTVAGEYRVINSQNTPLSGFSGNEAGGCLSVGLSIWRIGAPGGLDYYADAEESVIEDLKLWHISDFSVYNYETNRVTWVRPKIRNSFDVLRNNRPYNFGFWSSDYTSFNYRVVGGDIQGCAFGYWEGPVGDQTVTDTYFHCYQGVVVRPMWHAQFGGAPLPARRLDLNNNTWDPVANMSTVGDWGSQAAIRMDGTPHAGGTNLIQRDEVWVTNHQGAPGDNFRLFYPEQANYFILPRTVYRDPSFVSLMGSPVSGLSNADNLATYGVCYAGEILPEGSLVRDEIYGRVIPT